MLICYFLVCCMLLHKYLNTLTYMLNRKFPWWCLCELQSTSPSFYWNDCDNTMSFICFYKATSIWANFSVKIYRSSISTWAEYLRYYNILKTAPSHFLGSVAWSLPSQTVGWIFWNTCGMFRKDALEINPKKENIQSCKNIWLEMWPVLAPCFLDSNLISIYRLSCVPSVNPCNVLGLHQSLQWNVDPNNQHLLLN